MGGEGLGNQIIIKVSGHQQLPGHSERNFIWHKIEILLSDSDAVLTCRQTKMTFAEISWELLPF